LVGPLSSIGRGCVVHLGEDDMGMGHTDESMHGGSAGAKMGCGVIGRSDS